MFVFQQEKTMDWIEITTLNQLLFHLKSGEVVAFMVSDADAFLRAEEEHYRIIIQPPFRSAFEATGGQEQVEKLFAELKKSGTRFWVLPGAELCRVDSFWQRIVAGFRQIIARWFG